MKEPHRVIPQHLVKLMSPEDQKKYGFETIEVRNERLESQLERDLHTMFLAFLNRHGLGYYHAEMSKKSPFTIGQPDFAVYRGSRIMFVEFKVGKNKLAPEQKEQIAKLLTDGNTVHVCYSYPAAVDAVKSFFGTDHE